MTDRLNLLIVDDSRLFRSALEAALAGQPQVAVVGSVFSGAKAIEFIRTPPDLVTLDVEMPGMDGLETLKQIKAFNDSRPSEKPVGVIMVSAFTRRGAEVTVKALQAGAFDFVAKPSGGSAEENIASLRDELLAKIRAFANTRRVAGPKAATIAQPPAAVASRRPGTRSRMRAVVIGASTGGPRALCDMLPELCSLVDLPILIVQHMPAGFTRSLAESLGRLTQRNVAEAADGMAIEKANVYVAPGGKHLLLRGTSASPMAALNEQPPENGCRPSADVLFRSAAALFDGEVIAVILTGMGRDGTAGLGAIRRAGGHVIAQDEASSVVWGMPGSAVESGFTDEVQPLNRIARAVAAAIPRGIHIAMELKPQTLQALSKLIHQWSGVVIGDDKAYLVRHRLEPLVKSGMLVGFDDLLHRLQMKGQSGLCDAVLDAITTQETSFFRDGWFFDALMQHILPELALLLKPAGGARSRIRIWSAGASTGQEPYSLAMLVREFIDASNGRLKDHQFSILASDISAAALHSAEEGFYTKAKVGRGISEMRLNRHFVRRGNGWVANDSLRRLVEFRPFNLMHSPVDLGVFDLVLCRNVLIYFDEPTRERVSRGLNQVLQSGGWLGLGSAESLHAAGGLHAVKLGLAVLYRKGPAAT